MSGPNRIQRKRTKGWKMPENAVYVGRPTKWGNPALIERAHGSWWTYAGDVGPLLASAPVGTASEARAAAVRYYEAFIKHPTGIIPPTDGWNASHAYVAAHNHLTDALANDLAELAGKDLACWCPLDQPCHADVLLEIANN
ncbi:DUF4326 domain-containing protein [Rhodococcus sp. NPDC060176]|uniref:DUF4326 domain-containing protein n=1 Tax=Rhodococcus sp. NPDC060176 TaxID=3347062 RepID=UPI003661AC81